MRAFLFVVLFAVASAVPAATGSALDRYLDGLVSLRASFEQELIDARGRTVQTASGLLIVQRPGRFRWELRPSGAGEQGGQLLVADGRNLWFFDRDLEQVIVKPAAGALTATPASLLAGGADVRESFEISDVGDREGLAWVRVRPRDAQGDFREALLGFQGRDLKRMAIEDRLGQTAMLIFSSIVRNGRIADQELAFVPPAGADVIGKPAD